MTEFHVLDVLLVLGLTLRLTHLVIADDLGKWFVQEPANRWAGDGWRWNDAEEELEPTTWKAKLVSGLDCPWCIGFWIGCLCLLTLALVGGPGHAAEWWRWIAGAFTVNYICAHSGARLGDTGHKE